MVQCHKDACKKWRLRLEYTYLLLDKFITSRISPEIKKKDRILTSFSLTESSHGDKIILSLEMELRKFSINIFQGLKLIFCLVSSTIWEIEVRAFSVSQKINESLYFRGTFGASNFNFTFKTSDKRKKICKQNLRKSRTHFAVCVCVHF